MSKRVIFVGLLCSLVGLIMGREIVFAGFDPQQAHYTQWLGALFFPAGVMLLLGIKGSRAMLSLLLGAFYLIWAKVVLAVMLHPSFFRERIGPLTFWAEGSQEMGIQALPFICVIAVMAVAAMLLVHWMLYTKPFDDHLDDSLSRRKSEESKPS